MREKSTQTLMSAADAPTEEALLSGSSPTMVTSGAGAGVRTVLPVWADVRPNAYGVARFDARLGGRVRAGARRCSKRLVGACVFAHDGNRRGFSWGRTAHEGLSFATGVELGRLIGAGVLAYDGDAASLACFPGARLC